MKFKLQDICDMQSGGTPKRGVQAYYDGNIPWATITDFGNAIAGEIFETKESITVLGLKSINNRLFKKGTLLLAMYGSIGKTAIAGIELSTNQAILGINPKNENQLNTKFLKYWFDYNKGFIYSQGKGATLHNISLTVIKRQEVELPDIQTQNKIVLILDKASSLVSKREDSIRFIEEFLKATFLDMFGDPISNSKKWGTALLNEIANLERGRFSPRPRNDPSYFNGKHPFIQTGDINNSKYRLKTFTQTLNEKGIKVSKKFNIGDIIIAIVGATIGATSILQINAYATDSIIAIKSKEKTNNVFLEMLLRFYRQVLLDTAPEAARANINLSILGGLKIITPPIELQNKYLAIDKTIEDKVEKLSSALYCIVELQNSLLQKIFNGQLNFNVDLELDALISEIDLQKKQNDLSKIVGDIAYLQRLVDKLNSREFKEKNLYDKAKHGAFQLMTFKEGGSNVIQKYDKKSKSIKLALK